MLLSRSEGLSLRQVSTQWTRCVVPLRASETTEIHVVTARRLNSTPLNDRERGYYMILSSKNRNQYSYKETNRERKSLFFDDGVVEKKDERRRLKRGGRRRGRRGRRRDTQTIM